MNHFFTALFLAGVATGAQAGQTAVANAAMDPPIALGAGQCISLPGGKCALQLSEPLPGWTVSGVDAGVLAPADGMYSTPWSGASVGFSGSTLDGPGTLTQTLGRMKANAHYTLRLAAGCRLDKPCSGYQVQVLFNGVVAHTFVGGAASQVPGAFQKLTFGFDSAGGQWLTVVLSGVRKSQLAEVDFDDVSMSYRLTSASE